MGRKRWWLRSVVGAAIVVAALLAAGRAGSKDFEPGDLRVCNAHRCVPVTNRAVLRSIATFYYGSTRLSTAPSPPTGVPYFELRFRGGYVTGVIATVKLDRFLSYGVNLDRFGQGTWYRVPPPAAIGLRTLTRPLRPLRLTAETLEKSH